MITLLTQPDDTAPLHSPLLKDLKGMGMGDITVEAHYVENLRDVCRKERHVDDLTPNMGKIRYPRTLARAEPFGTRRRVLAMKESKRLTDSIKIETADGVPSARAG